VLIWQLLFAINLYIALQYKNNFFASISPYLYHVVAVFSIRPDGALLDIFLFIIFFWAITFVVIFANRNTDYSQYPRIALTSPATLVVPDIVDTPKGVRRQIDLIWENTDPNIESTVALYWDTAGTGFVGNLIVDGLRQDAGARFGSYTWNVTALAPGNYHVYAIIYNTKGVGKAYAPGAVAICSSN
jgi:hypothetical protein